jgi:DnaJ-class molecular chaperone
MTADKPCPGCGGTGTRPRGRRLLDGELDPLDLLGRFPELCPDCAGSGRLCEKPPSRPGKLPGRAADI